LTSACFEQVERDKLSTDEVQMLLRAARCFADDASPEGILKNEDAAFFRMTYEHMEIIAAFLISDTELLLWLVGGKPRSFPLVDPFLRAVEKLAREQGCKKIRSVSRPGAMRMLQKANYRCVGYAMVKEI